MLPENGGMVLLLLPLLAVLATPKGAEQFHTPMRRPVAVPAVLTPPVIGAPVGKTIGWDTVEGAVDYQVYVGPASRVYTNRFDAGGTNTYLLTTNELVRGITNFVAVTAVGSNRDESDFSNELAFKGTPVYTNVQTVVSVLTNSTISGTWQIDARFPSVTLSNTPDTLYFKVGIDVQRQ